MKVAFILSLFLWSGIIYVIVDSIPESKVYACSEVTKQDPVDVQKLCKKAWKRNEQ